ncbi:MAG: Mur ligase family protein, partial [Clostridia bacterium]|nr:Mur ligase family protein [Clostridia bacterium]
MFNAPPETGLTAVCLAAMLVGYAALLRTYLHVLQLESYRTKNMVMYFLERPGLGIRAMLAVVGGLAGWFAGQWLLGDTLVTAGFCGMAVVFCAAAVAVSVRPKAQKKPLVYTARACRIMAASLVTAAAAPLVLLLLEIHPIFLLLALLPAVWPQFLLAMGNFLVLPLEKIIANRFKRRAMRKLASFPKLRVVGITGSYGKTSVKFILKTLLDERYTTLATPGSYNTPMGVCRAVLEELNDTHEIFICEMGARRTGDIAELCAMV